MEWKFDFSGGQLCLDFVNTVDDRATSPLDRLATYGDLVAWGQQAQILLEATAHRLLELAGASPHEASAVLHQVREVREAIFRIFVAVTQEREPPGEDMQRINAQLAQAMEHARIIQDGQQFRWAWAGMGEALESVLWPVVRATADLLTSDNLPLVRICAADDCRWLFLDTSKNHSRRWCSMSSCGNRAKARRHSIRQRQVSF
ncbi:MAG: ABATE domain-containing protein [Ktedonobacteraceae bacterium]|nr:ABATE domain-containing protein [Ktedonobacteraceae bacterium]